MWNTALYGFFERSGRRLSSNRSGHGLMHHVSDTSDAVQSALFDLGVQPGRMPLKVSDTVVLGDDYDRPHFASS
jgi:hypothetical protein